MLAPQALWLRPAPATHLAEARLPPLAPVKGRVISLGLLPRFGISDPENLTQGHTVLCMSKRTGNYEQIICHQNHYSWDFIPSHTHTLSFPFTWVLLMDLGLRSADNINGSRLTEVPLQWTVCLHIYTQLWFFKIQFQAKSQNLYNSAIQAPSSFCFLIWPTSRTVPSKHEVLLIFLHSFQG